LNFLSFSLESAIRAPEFQFLDKNPKFYGNIQWHISDFSKEGAMRCWRRGEWGCGVGGWVLAPQKSFFCPQNEKFG